MRLFLLLSCIVSLSLSLAACGGGGNGDPDFANFPGRFVGPAIAGLEYETETGSGVTGPQGQFDFETGETITFRIGDTELGTAPAKALMSPLDLVEDATPPRTNDELYRAVHYELRSPEAKLFNLIVFLQTLDADGDLANGIQVPVEVRALLAGIQIDFDLDVREFNQHVPFRRLIREGLLQGLWGGVGRPIRNLGRAIDAFYGYAGIQHQFEYERSSAWDEDGDGTPEGVQTIITITDEQIEAHFDEDADGVADALYRLVFTPTGNLNKSQFDEGNDGTIDREEVVEYDEHGDPERAYHYEGNVLEGAYYVTTDEFGLAEIEDEDDDGDGTIDYRYTRYRDADGRVYRIERDDGANGTVDRITTKAYDAKGHERLSEEDTDADGAPNRRFTYETDAMGRRTLYERDDGADGDIDYRVRTTYDDVNRTEFQQTDSDGDGVYDKVHLMQHDAQGRPIRRDRDDDADGTLDSRTTWTYTSGRIVQTTDHGLDGTIDYMRTILLNAAGNATSSETDEDNDGTTDYAESRQWAPGSAWHALQLGGQV